MKANEAPKSKFVYPDKLYARTNDNITLDISYAPQTLEAVEYIMKDTFIKKACQFLSEKCDLCIYEEFDPENRTYYINYDKIVDKFRKYMEGE